MKKMIAAMSAGLMMLATSCVEPESEISVKAQQPEEMQSKTVTFTFGEDRGGTRATLQELNITDLWLFDYVGDELKQTIHKTEGFDALTLSMDYSEHRLCFVASRGADPTVTAPNISWEKPSDTFWATLTMDVQPATSATQSVTLKRVATRLRIGITDEITSQMVRLEVEPVTWYYGIDVQTGEGTDARRQVRSVTIPASYIGTQGQLTASFFGLSLASDWQTDIDVRLIGSEESMLGSVSLPSVRFAQNLTTVYSGGIMGAGRSVSLTADDAWDDENTHTW
jgi:hypothetical protein